MGFIWDHHVPTALIVLVTWLCCLGVCWLTVVFAALEIPAIATLPARFIVFLAIIWLAVEVLAGLLPTAGLAISAAGRDALDRNRSFIAANTPNKPSNTSSGYGNLIDLLERASVRSRASRTLQASNSVPTAPFEPPSRPLHDVSTRARAPSTAVCAPCRPKGASTCAPRRTAHLFGLSVPTKRDCGRVLRMSLVFQRTIRNALWNPTRTPRTPRSFPDFHGLYAFLQRKMSMIGASRTPRPG